MIDLSIHPDPEAATLGALLIDPAQIQVVRQILPRSGAFFDARNRIIYQAICALSDRGRHVDLLTLSDELERLHVLEQVGGVVYIAELSNCVPSSINAADYAGIVKDNAAKQYIETVASRLVVDANNGKGTVGAITSAIDVLRSIIERMDTKPDRFEPHWAHEALEEIPPIDWIIEGVLSAGSVAILAGDGGSGKTWSLLDAAVCVAMGSSWLDFPTVAGPVLIIDEESGENRLKRRIGDVMRGHGAGEDLPLAFVSMAGFNLYESAHVMTLRDLVKANGARLVIIDALIDVMPGGDENKACDVQPVFHALRTITEECRAAVIVIHHTNKAGGYRGSTALKGAADVLLIAEKSEDSNDIVFHTEKNRDGEPLKFSAQGRWGHNQFDLMPVEIEQSKQYYPKGEAYVLKYLLEHGESLLTDIQGHADICSGGTARQAVYALTRRNLTVRVDPGGNGQKAAYGLTEQGRLESENL